MISSIESLIDADYARSLAQNVGATLPKWLLSTGKVRKEPISVLYQRAIESDDVRVMRAACLVLYYNSNEWSALTQKALHWIADEKKHDVFMELMLSTSRLLEKEDRALFSQLMVTAKHEVLGTALLVLKCVGEGLNDVQRSRIVGEADALVATGSLAEWKEFVELVSADESSVVKALSRKSKSAPSLKSNGYRALSVNGVEFWKYLAWCKMQGADCKRELIRELCFYNRVWNSEQREVWRGLPGIKPILQTENLLWALDSGLADSVRVPLDSDRCMRVLESKGCTGLKVLQNSLTDGKIFVESAERHRDIYEKLFSKWRLELLGAYESLNGTVQGCREYQLALEYGKGELCAEAQYWIQNHGEEAQEWAENFSDWTLNKTFQQLGFWDGELHTELIDDDWQGGAFKTAAVLAWGEEVEEKAEGLPWNARFRDLPNKEVLDDCEWYANWCHSEGPTLPENWELVKATNGEVPLNELEDWKDCKGEKSFFFLGATFWKEWDGGSLAGLPEGAVKVFAKNPKLLKQIVEWQPESEARVLNSAFYNEIDPTEWKELPEILKEPGEVAWIGWKPEYANLLELDEGTQELYWQCWSTELPDGVSREAIVSSSLLVQRLLELPFGQWFAGRDFSDELKVKLLGYPFHWDSESLKYWQKIVESGIEGSIENCKESLVNALGIYWLKSAEIKDCRRFFDLFVSGRLEEAAKVTRRYDAWCTEVRDAFLAWLNEESFGRKSRFLAGVGSAFEFDEAVLLAQRIGLYGNECNLMILNLLDEAWELRDDGLYRFYPIEEGALEVLEWSEDDRFTVCENRECWVGLGRFPQIHLVNGKVATIWDRDQIALI